MKMFNKKNNVKMKFKLISDLDLYIMYVIDINNSLLITKELYELYEKKEYISIYEFMNIVHLICPDEVDKYEKILTSLEKVKKIEEHLDNICVSDIIEEKEVFTLCIHATRRCNLQCKYCFGEENYLPQKEISIDVAKKAIDYVVFQYGKKAQMYNIDLAGSGEPLLRFDFLKEIEEHCEILRNQTGKKIIISFPTNATLLNKGHITYFEEHPDILYGISLDGNKECNSNRIYKNGENAFDDAMRGIEIVSNEHSGIAVTITNKNENVDEIYDFIYSIGKFDAISMHLVRDFTDSETSLYKINQEYLVENYKKLTKRLISELLQENYKYVTPLLNGDDIYGGYISGAFHKGVIPKYRCDAGQNRMTVDDLGNLYACSVMNGNKDFYIGNIWEGVETKNRDKFFKSNIKESTVCSKCWCQNICRGECMTISYLTNGEFYHQNDFMCEIRKKLIEMAISFEEYVKHHIPKAYMILTRYFIGIQNNSKTDSAIWSVLHYLNYNSQKVSYREVVSDLGCTQEENIFSLEVDEFQTIGIGVKKLEKILKKYNPDNCCVTINSVKDLPQLTSPIICYYKGQEGRHEYCIIRQDSCGDLKIKSLENTLTDIPFTDRLVQNGFNVLLGPFESMLSE